MKIKNKIMFISLILLVLLSMACVSATQELDSNSTLQADDTSVDGVLTSCDTKIQSNESNHVDSQMNLLSYNVADDTSSDIVNNGDVVGANHLLTENVVASNVGGTSAVEAAVEDNVLGVSNAKDDVSFVAPNRTLMIDEIINGYTYPVVLKNSNGANLGYRNVTLVFNGRTYVETTNKNGWAYFNINVDKTGTYKTTLKFAGDENYNALSCYDFTFVKVNGYDVYFVAPDRTVLIDDITRSYSYPVVLKDSNGNKLANQKITFIFNGQTYVGTTAASGWVYFKISVPKTGTYKTTIKYAGDGYYNPLTCTGFSTITVTGHDVYFVAPNRTLMIDDTMNGYTYPVVLKDSDGNNLPNQKVTLFLTGKTYVGTTDSNGWVYFSITLKKPGTYNTTLKYTGDGYYNALSCPDFTFVKVTGHDVSFVAPNRTIYLNESSNGYTYPVVLKDSNGKNLANQRVSLVLAGKTYVGTTNNNGWVYFNITLKKAGTYKTTIKYAGDGYYNSLYCYNITTVEVVVRKNVNFAASDRTLSINEISKGYNYQVILKDGSGKGLANKKVTITFNGKKQTGTTDSTGKVFFVLTANKEGKYSVSLEFPGDFYYYPKSLTNFKTITVINVEVVFVTEDKNIPLNEIYFGYNYPVILKDSTGKVLANKKLTITFNGKTQTLTTDKNGRCLFNIVYQNMGTVGMTIKFAGDGTYKASSVTKTIKITESTNPYGNKAKKAWINADSGSNDMKNAVANLLRKLGWTVYVDGTGPGYHYPGYFDVTSDYQVYITLYNGFCAGTIREAYSSSIQNTLNRKGVQLVVMWDTRDWTNPQGMAPYRYGDFTGYNAGRAWDDDFSKDDPSIQNVGQWLKNNNAKYCAYPTAEGLLAQFCAGGYFAYTGT